MAPPARFSWRLQFLIGPVQVTKMRARLALLIAATPFCLFAQTEKPLSDPTGPNTLQALGIEGPVHLIRETLIAHVQESEPEGSTIRIKTTTFSPDGRLIGVNDCDTQGSCYHTELRWNSNWVIEERQKTELMDKLTEYVRDAEGRPVREIQSQDFINGYVSHQETRYEYEQRSTVRTELVDDVLFEKRVRRQNSGSGVQQTSVYMRSRQPSGQMKWVLQSSHYAQSETASDGSVRIFSDLAEDKSSSVYDAHGRQIEETVDTPNSYNRTVYVYNNQGWMVEKSEWFRDGSQINCRKYTYQTDSHGNWIRKTEHFSSSAMETSTEGDVVVRNIEYF
jgi:hypothetical protein